MAPSTNAPLGDHIIHIKGELEHALRLCDEIRDRHPSSPHTELDRLRSAISCSMSFIDDQQRSASHITGENVGSDHADSEFF
jgi:hypothetical protein